MSETPKARLSPFCQSNSENHINFDLVMEKAAAVSLLWPLCVEQWKKHVRTRLLCERGFSNTKKTRGPRSKCWQRRSSGGRYGAEGGHFENFESTHVQLGRGDFPNSELFQINSENTSNYCRSKVGHFPNLSQDTPNSVERGPFTNFMRFCETSGRCAAFLFKNISQGTTFHGHFCQSRVKLQTKQREDVSVVVDPQSHLHTHHQHHCRAGSTPPYPTVTRRTTSVRNF